MASGSKIVFLDRDGTINRFPGEGDYVTKVKDFHFLPGVKAAIRSLKEHGYTVFVISNQACVGRGIISLSQLKRIDAKMNKDIEAAGGKIKESFYCIHHPDQGCPCRKPGIALVKAALKFVGKTLKDTRGAYFVGDTDKDIIAGKRAGCKTIFVSSGDKRSKVAKWTIKPDHTTLDLKGAVEIILHEDPSHSRHRRGRS